MTLLHHDFSIGTLSQILEKTAAVVNGEMSQQTPNLHIFTLPQLISQFLGNARSKTILADPDRWTKIIDDTLVTTWNTCGVQFFNPFGVAFFHNGCSEFATFLWTISSNKSHQQSGLCDMNDKHADAQRGIERL